MIPALATAVSGIRAGTVRLEAAASNIANAGTTGPGPGVAPADGRRAYIPVDVVQSAAPGGGVEASYAPRSPAHIARYAPDSPDADAAGLVDAPNVDLAREAVSAIEAALIVRANVMVGREADRMMDSVLDLKA